MKLIFQYIPKEFKFLLRKYCQKIPIYRSRKSYKDLKREGHKTRIILLGTPEYGNLGDHAIAIAELELLKKNFENYKIIEITQENLQWDMKGISSNIQADDLLIYTGGGFIGSLYLETGGKYLRKILQQFKNNKIIIMPATIYYNDTDVGMKEMKYDFELWNSCSDLTICVRDIGSKKILEKCSNRNFNYNLIPDMVLSLSYQVTTRREGIGVLFREDQEKNNNIKPEQIKNIIEKQGICCKNMSTRVPYNVEPELRNKEVLLKLEEISNVKLVITDRLHGLIFSIITGTPCIAIDNVSKKLSGVLETIDTLPYIKMSKEAEIEEDIRSMMEDGIIDPKYTYSSLQEPYIRLVELIRSKI